MQYYCFALEQSTGEKCSWLNAGCLSGNIDTVLELMQHASAFRQELRSGTPHSDIVVQIYKDFKHAWDNNDQVLYQLCQLYHPDLIQLDCNKDLFAVVRHFPDDVHERCVEPNNSRYSLVFNDAAIIHAPIPSNPMNKHNAPGNVQRWKEWAEMGKWQRNERMTI